MRRVLAALLPLALWSGAAFADCTGEVVAAVEKQRKSPAFRLTAELSGDGGKAEVTAEYLPPDRMHQKIVAPGQPAPLETIAIGRWAWGNQGGGWEELQPQFAQSVTSQVRQTLVDPQDPGLQFECLGKVAFEGNEYLAYRNVSRKAEGTPASNEPELARTFYVDPGSGLPAFNIVAQRDGNGAPVFKGTYSYPTNLTIEAPIGDQPVPQR